MPDINEILKNMSQSDLKAAIKKAQELANTAEGKELMKKMNKDELQKTIKNNPDIMKKINGLL